MVKTIPYVRAGSQFDNAGLGVPLSDLTRQKDLQ